ncbi:hydroxyacid dehydrogenase, partial [Chloroflexota bacterium]
MQKWKVIITDGLSEKGQAILRDDTDVKDLTGISAKDLLEMVNDCDALIVRGRTKVTAAILEAGPNIKVVGRAGVGVDNIDLAAAQSRGVTVVNSPIATTIAVAEHTLALMLSLVRHITPADASMKSGLWNKKKLAGIELNGKILGIIGMGHIGSGVAQRAAIFGTTILGYDPFLDEASIHKRGAQPVKLNDLLARSDLISLHIPLTPESRGMINGQTIGLMKRGTYLICAARGGVIDETALLNALESGQIAGAALDVFNTEPPGLTALVAHPNVVATPHIGAQTAEAQVRAAVDISE